MKNYTFLFVCFLILSLAACGDDAGSDGGDNMPEEMVNTFSFTIDGQDYSYTEDQIALMHDTLTSGTPRLFLRAEDGDLIFTFNANLDNESPTVGLDWNEGQFFFMRLDQGDFYFLDESTCTMEIEENDTANKFFRATFSGEGTQVFSDDAVTVSDGLIHINY